MSTVQEDLKPKGVYHCRGGIERYVKTFPEGGYWKGKNYLFDRRMEQTPDIKTDNAVEDDIDAKCCLCRVKWTVYRGQFKCNRSLCRVPVIVCESCTGDATAKPETLVCELCREGYKAPCVVPDLVAMKRKADAIVEGATKDDAQDKKRPKKYYTDRLFLRRLPLTASFTKVKDAMGTGKVTALKWLTDEESGGFYGSCIIQLSSSEDMKQILERGVAKGGIRIEKKKIKVAEVFMKCDEGMFENFVQKEFPPVGN